MRGWKKTEEFFPNGFLSENAVHAEQTFDKPIDFPFFCVSAEACADSRWNAEALHDRLGAVVSAANGATVFV